MKTKRTLFYATTRYLLGILCCLFCITSSLSAQNGVSGKIVDAQNEPFVGASVLVKGTTNGTFECI